MKCKEIMVGDWVATEHDFPMQVVNVGDDYAYATFEGNEGDLWEFDDKDSEPHPIEITAELLKTNGWKLHTFNFLGDTYTSFLSKDENRNHLEWRFRNLSIWIDYEKDNDGVYSDIVFPCKYVHQFQQVLRLTGMTDIANNFKI